MDRPLPGVLLLEGRCFADGRGFFMETFHRGEFDALGISGEFVQDNHSRSAGRVIRGLHFQGPPAPMGKLVRTTVGRILDVVLDIRAGSPTFGRWASVELSAENRRQLWIPPGFAHGVANLGEACEIQYRCTAYWVPSAEGCIAWNDPAIAIRWPFADAVVSARDAKGIPFADYARSPAFRFEEGA